MPDCHDLFLFSPRTSGREHIWPHPMIDKLQRVVAWLMNRVRVNQIQQSVQDGVSVFVKRRRAGGSIVIWFGNRFLALARSRICMFVRADEWVDWEVHCARLLYPERPAVKPLSLTNLAGNYSSRVVSQRYSGT